MHVKYQEPLAAYTSLKAGGPAERLIILEPQDHLREVLEQTEAGPVWILGYGTNCLISDKGLPGTVILNRTGQLDRISSTRFRAESGLNWDDLVQEAIAQDLWGIEFASGIPGGVGAAIVGNIAAYGHKVADVFVEATLYDPAHHRITIWSHDDMAFSYRSSALQKAENQLLVIIDATFELSPTPTKDLEYASALKTAAMLDLQPDTLAHRRNIIMETRRRAGSLLQDTSTGPWTAGSFFKNPLVNEEQVQAIIAHEETDVTPEQLLRQSQIHTGSITRVSAAHVLLAAGFHRGQTWGQVRLHPDHILKVENLGQATAQEMHDVVSHILATVKEKLGIVLEPEVRLLGDF